MAYPFCNPYISEEELMTLQIGMIACDGVVLASDRRAVGGLIGLLGGPRPVTHSSEVRKILLSKDSRLACAFSGSDRAHVAAIRIAECWDSNSSEDLLSVIRTAIAGITGVNNEQLLVAVSGISGVRLVRVFFDEAGPVVQRIVDKLVNGDVGNGAIYIPERFYAKSKSVEDLKLLAAHFVLEGGKLNPTMVRGLDIYVMRDGESAHFLSPDEMADLERRSAGISTLMEASLFGSTP
jgi:hypothetical protein